MQAVGPVRLYAEALAGVGHQYYWGLPVSGVIGVAIAIKQTRFSVIPFDGTYAWYAAQSSTRAVNSRKGRVEGFAGLQYHFGKKGLSVPFQDSRAHGALGDAAAKAQRKCLILFISRFAAIAFS